MDQHAALDKHQKKKKTESAEEWKAMQQMALANSLSIPQLEVKQKSPEIKMMTSGDSFCCQKIITNFAILPVFYST